MGTKLIVLKVSGPKVKKPLKGGTDMAVPAIVVPLAMLMEETTPNGRERGTRES